jgi:hypothetical protein
MTAPRMIAVTLTADAIAEVCSIADEQGSSIAAAGRTLIVEALRARGRDVSGYIDHMKGCGRAVLGTHHPTILKLHRRNRRAFSAPG